jgi:hypothetical protein
MSFVRESLESAKPQEAITAAKANNEPSIQFVFVDCRDVDVEIELDHYFGPKGNILFTLQLLLLTNLFIEDKSNEKNKNKPKDATNIFVVLNSHLLSEEHRHHVASYSIAVGYYLIMVMPSFNPETLLLRVKTPNSNQNKILRVRNSIPSISFFCSPALY